MRYWIILPQCSVQLQRMWKGVSPSIKCLETRPAGVCVAEMSSDDKHRNTWAMSLPPRVFQQVWSTHEDNSVYLIYSLPSRIIIHICFFHAKDVNESNTGAAKCHAGNREQLFLIHWMFKSIDSQVSPSFTDATILRCSVTVSGTCLSNHKLHGVTDRLDKYHHPWNKTAYASTPWQQLKELW